MLRPSRAAAEQNMNVSHAGSEGGRREPGGYLSADRQTGALQGEKTVPGSCAVDVSRHFCCNVILLFIRQAGSRSARNFDLLGPFSEASWHFHLLACVGIHVLTDNCLSDALMDLSWADGLPTLPTQQQPPLPQVITNWF